MSRPSFNPPEVFISYAHDDAACKKELVKQLGVLQQLNLISSWHDGELVAGQQWNEEIIKHLNAARIILLLISPNFANSSYIHKVEMKLASERRKAEGVTVIPVLVSNLNSWDKLPFGDITLGDLHVLPTGAKFIEHWDNPTDAYADVARGIEQAAAQLTAGQAPDGESTTDDVRISSLALIPRPPAVGFVARRDAAGRDIVELLKAELAPERNQLVVLWGAGGVGKTTLAVEAAQAMTDVFGRRIVWASPELRVDLTLTTLLDEIAAQLGCPNLRALAPEAKEEQVRALLAVAPGLVILDNFETIAPDEQTRCAKWLARRARCPALITTRQRVEGARNISINAMTPAEAGEFVERWIKQEAHNAPAFEGLERDRVIEAAGRNPLVLQWVLARIDLAGEPNEVLDALMHGEGDAAQRVFDASFNLPQLGQDGRDALLALSLFVPDASRDALAEVAGFDDDGRSRLNEAVTRLASLWLIETTAGNKRLKIEGLTRELTKTHLARDARADEFRQRFVAYFLRHVEAHPQPTPEDYEALEAEKDNALNAMDVAFNIKDWESVLHIARVLVEPDGMLSVHGYWDEVIQYCRRGLEAAQITNDEWRIGAFAHALGVIIARRGDYILARRYYELAVEVARRLDAKRGLAATLYQLGKLAETQRELGEAQRLYDESLEIAKSLSDQKLIAVILHELGNIAYSQDRLEEARRLYDESLKIKKRLGNQSFIASTLHQLAMLAHDQGDLAGARRLYAESLEIKKRLGDLNGIAITLHELGSLTFKEGKREEAWWLLRESLSIFDRLKSPNAELARENLRLLEGESS